jgi:hypothetical protein
MLSLPAGAMSTADMLQEKALQPLSTTAIGEIAPILIAFMSSNMDAGQKERTAAALIELAKYKIDSDAKGGESKWKRVFEVIVMVVSLAGTIFTTVKVTS